MRSFTRREHRAPADRAPASGHGHVFAGPGGSPVPPGGALSASAVPPRRGPGVGAFVLVIATAGALAHVGVRLKGLEVAYDLGRERRIATDLDEQRRRLQIEIGMLKDPVRVVSLARDELDMAPPAPEAIHRLGSGPLAPAPDSAGPAAASPRAKLSSTAKSGTNGNRTGGSKRGAQASR